MSTKMRTKGSAAAVRVKANFQGFLFGWSIQMTKSIDLCGAVTGSRIGLQERGERLAPSTLHTMPAQTRSKAWSILACKIY